MAGIDFESVALPSDSSGFIKRTRINISFQTGQEGDEYTIVLQGGTTNRMNVVTSVSATATSGIILNKGNLTIQGKGSLEIISPGDDDYATISANKKLTIKDTTISLNCQGSAP